MFEPILPDSDYSSFRWFGDHDRGVVLRERGFLCVAKRFHEKVNCSRPDDDDPTQRVDWSEQSWNLRVTHGKRLLFDSSIIGRLPNLYTAIRIGESIIYAANPPEDASEVHACDQRLPALESLSGRTLTSLLIAAGETVAPRDTGRRGELAKRLLPYLDRVSVQLDWIKPHTDGPSA